MSLCKSTLGLISFLVCFYCPLTRTPFTSISIVGGTAEPAGNARLTSIGQINRQKNKETSKKISAVLENELGIVNNRLYIEFVDLHKVKKENTLLNKWCCPHFVGCRVTPLCNQSKTKDKYFVERSEVYNENQTRVTIY